MKNARHSYAVVTVIVMLGMLLLPVVQMFFHFLPEKEVTGENRAMAEFPMLKLSNMDAFPGQFDCFFSDHFPFRGDVLDISFQYNLLRHQSPIPEVVIGKRDFLFSGKGEKDLYEGKLAFSELEQQLAVEELACRAKRLDSMGIRFYVVVAPTAMEVYPEYLPDYMQRADRTVTEQFCAMMRERAPEIRFVYLKEKMLQNKRNGRLYYKNDNHWNPVGGYYAAEEILRMMREDYPPLPESLEGQFVKRPYVKTSGNLGDMIAVSDRFRYFAADTDYRVSYVDSTRFQHEEVSDRRYEPIPGFAYPWEYEMRYRTNREKPKLLVIRDSYAGAVMPYLSPYFSESVFIFDAWRYGPNWDIVEQEHPDIVLLMIYEPHIHNIVQYSLSQ